MTKKKEIKWYAIRHDFNSDKLEYVNVLYDDLLQEVKKALKKGAIYKDIRDLIEMKLKSIYAHRVEYEVIITGMFPKYENEFKIDVWYQLEPNLDIITEYIIEKLS